MSTPAARLLDSIAARWALRRMNPDPGEAVILVREHPGRWAMAYCDRNDVDAWFAPSAPLPVDQWTNRQLRRWLKDHPEPR